MIASITAARAQGTCLVPPSKSEMHRILIANALAALQKGERPHFFDAGENDDIQATCSVLSALALRKTADCRDSGSTLPKMMDCRDSASTLRFLLPVSLALYGEGRFTGSERLIQRGISGYKEAFRPFGIRFFETGKSIEAEGKLTSGTYCFPGDLSSQYLSGMLFSLPLLSGDSELVVTPPVESRPYLQMTAGILKRHGIDTETAELPDGGLRIFIPGGQTYREITETPKGDWSGGANFLLLNEIGGNVLVKGLGNPEESLQGDSRCAALFKKLDEDNPVIDLADCPDLGPVLFSAAALKHGGIFLNVRRLKNKESDRVAAMRDILAAFGAETAEKENVLAVRAPGTLRKPKSTLSGAGDHRIVMAAAILLSVTGGAVSDAEAVRKSFPGFFTELKKIGIPVSLL